MSWYLWGQIGVSALGLLGVFISAWLDNHPPRKPLRKISRIKVLEAKSLQMERDCGLVFDIYGDTHWLWEGYWEWQGVVYGGMAQWAVRREGRTENRWVIRAPDVYYDDAEAMWKSGKVMQTYGDHLVPGIMWAEPVVFPRDAKKGIHKARTQATREKGSYPSLAAATKNLGVTRDEVAREIQEMFPGLRKLKRGL